MDEERLEGQPSQPLADPDSADSPAVPAQETPSEEPVRRPERRRGLMGCLMMILIIVLFIIILWLLRQCGVNPTGGASDGGDKRIEAVRGMKPVPNTVSVWIDEKTTIDRVLVGANVSPHSITDMAKGRFIVEVDGVSAEDAAERIAAQYGVNDAGLVYEPAEAAPEQDE